jgi:hypothetical protein
MDDRVVAPLARVVRTCIACPSQWDAWTVDGQYLYLRYRWSVGEVTPDSGPDGDLTAEPLVTFGEPGGLDGTISLAEFLGRAGLELAPDAEVVGEPAA